MASLVVTMHVEVRLPPLVELRPAIDHLILIVDHASNTVAAIVAVDGTVIARGVPPIMMMIGGHSLDQSAEDGAADNSADVMATVVVHAGIGIKGVAAAMMIASDIGKNPGATLRDPDIFAPWIVAPGPVQNARACGSLMNELWLAERSCPAFTILIVP